MPKPLLAALFLVGSLALGYFLANGPGSRSVGDAAPGNVGGGERVAALERIEGLLAEILAETRHARTVGSDAPGLKTIAEPAPAQPQPAQPVREDLRGNLNPADPGGRLLPPAEKKRLAPIDDWDEDEETRRRWMFLSQKRALAWFGTPDEVSILESGAETWLYWAVDGRKEQRQLTFSRGRLTRID